MILLQFGNENVVSRSLLANSAVPPHNKEARVCHPSKRRVDQQSLFMSSYDKFSIFIFFIVAEKLRRRVYCTILGRVNVSSDVTLNICNLRPYRAAWHFVVLSSFRISHLLNSDSFEFTSQCSQRHPDYRPSVEQRPQQYPPVASKKATRCEFLPILLKRIWVQ